MVVFSIPSVTDLGKKWSCYEDLDDGYMVESKQLGLCKFLWAFLVCCLTVADQNVI